MIMCQLNFLQMAKNYVESYTFDATDSMKVTIPVFLDEEQLNRDDALH